MSPFCLISHSRSLLTLVGVLIAGALLAGCESLGPVAGGTGPQGGENSFTVVSVIGAPEAVKTGMTTELNTSARALGLSVASGPANPAGRNLTGYLSAITETNGTAFSYVWDVFDAAGNRVHRVEGKEVSAERPSDPWLAAKQPVLKKIADSSMASLAAWSQTTTPTTAPAAQPAPASGQQSAAPPTTNTPPNAALAASPEAPTPSLLTGRLRSTVSTQPVATVQSASTSRTANTGATIQQAAFQRFSRSSQSRTPVTYLLYGSVKGASGDGNKALLDAIQAALQPYQIALVNTLPRRASDRDAKILSAEITNSGFDKNNDAVAVIWQMEDGSGEIVGTVRQFRKVKKASLAGSWGEYANKAAASAAPEIASLLAN